MDLAQSLFARHVAWTSGTPLGLTVAYAEGPYIYLADGRSLLDMISGIAVSSVGHRHPRVIAAIRDQLDRYLHVMVYGEFVQEPQVRLAANLARHLPESLQVCYFVNSGTEANEGALKLAKKHTGRTRLIGFEHSYHGDTHGSLSVTGRAVYQDPFRPLLPDVSLLPFNDMRALEKVDERVAAVITEPIQGEGGIRIPGTDWMRRLRSRCSDVGAVLIFDEVQTGLGRTGKMFAFEHFDVVPDVITLAKSFGGGLPLGGFIARRALMDTLRDDPPLSHVTTFGGNPLSCAAGNAALEVITESRLHERANEIAVRVKSRLAHPLIREVRGLGALLGMELSSAAVTESFVRRCLDRGILLGWTLHSSTLVRIAPPLIIEWEILDEALDQMLSILDTC